MTAALRTALVALVALALAAPAGAQPTAAQPAKAKHCKRGYRLKTVKRKLRRHGHVVHRHGHVVWVKRKVCRKRHATTTTTQPTTTLAPTPKVTVALDGVGQAPASPFAATYGTHASSDQGELPTGLLNVYEDGLLKCSKEVSSADPRNDCPVQTKIGQHEVIVTYVSDQVSGLTATDTSHPTVDPFSTSTTASFTSTYFDGSEGGGYGHHLYIKPAAAVTDEHGNGVASGGSTVDVIDQTTGTVLMQSVPEFNIGTELNGHDAHSLYPGPSNGNFEQVAEIPQADVLAIVAHYPGADGYRASVSAPVAVATTP